MKTIPSHLGHLKRRNIRATTIDHRRDNLVRLYRALDKPLLEATEKDLDTWQQSLRVTPSSIATYTSHVRGFYQWAYDAELVAADVSRRLIIPKIPRRAPRPIPEQDLHAAIVTARSLDYQLYCWFLLAGYCGLRAGEISRVGRSDFRPDDRDGGAFLTVHGKGGNQRVVRVPPEVYREIAILMHKQGPVFVREDGKPFTPARISQLSSMHLHGLGLPYTLHTMRHRFGTRLADLGADVRDIQDALGHANLATTTIYLASSARRVSETVDMLGTGLKALRSRIPVP